MGYLKCCLRVTVLVLLVALTACSKSPSQSRSAGPTDAAAPSTTAPVAPTKTTTVVRTVPPAQGIVFIDEVHGWASGAAGVLATANGGRTWRLARASVKGAGPLAFLDKSVGWAVADGSLIATSDGGISWRTESQPHALDGAQQLVALDQRHGWAIVEREVCQGAINCDHPRTLLRTSDGGRTWAKSTPSSADVMCWASRNRGWIATGGAFETTGDGGGSWTPQTIPLRPGGTAGSLACFGATAWVLDDYGAAMGTGYYQAAVTLDSGAHWKLVFSNLVDQPGQARQIDNEPGPVTAVSATAAYFVGECNPCQSVSVTATSDGGETTHRYAVATSNGTGETLFPVALSFADSVHGWLLAGSTTVGGVIFATSDGGKTWRRQLSGHSLGPLQP